MLNRISKWLDVCKLHWKEIITMSIALHFITDLLIIGPLFYVLGAIFGLDWIHGGH